MSLAVRSGPYAKADRGCKGVSDRCIDCHLEICREEVSGGMATIRAERTRILVLGLHQMEWPVGTIASTLKVTKRTVHRMLIDG